MFVLTNASQFSGRNLVVRVCDHVISINPMCRDPEVLSPCCEQENRGCALRGSGATTLLRHKSIRLNLTKDIFRTDVPNSVMGQHHRVFQKD